MWVLLAAASSLIGIFTQARADEQFDGRYKECMKAKDDKTVYLPCKQKPKTIKEAKKDDMVACDFDYKSEKMCGPKGCSCRLFKEVELPGPGGKLVPKWRSIGTDAAPGGPVVVTPKENDKKKENKYACFCCNLP
jgi:hypothetical protein